MRFFFVYILASRRRTLYIGVTGNLEKRLIELRYPENPNVFTARYHIHRLVYVEEYTDVRQAIAREKQLKGWSRSKKVALIELMNPSWDDLAPPIPQIPRSRSG